MQLIRASSLTLKPLTPKHKAVLVRLCLLFLSHIPGHSSSCSTYLWSMAPSSNQLRLKHAQHGHTNRYRDSPLATWTSRSVSPSLSPQVQPCDGSTQMESCWNVHQDMDYGKGSSLHGVCLTLGRIKNSLATKYEMLPILTASPGLVSSKGLKTL